MLTHVANIDTVADAGRLDNHHVSIVQNPKKIIKTRSFIRMEIQLQEKVRGMKESGVLKL